MKAHVVGASGRCMKCGRTTAHDMVVLCDACLMKTLMQRNVIEIYSLVTNNKSLILVNPPTAGARWN